MKKKGQAAMEFLMTYGWAILVVLAAIGALAYFDVFSADNLLPETTTFAAPLQSLDTAVVDVDEDGEPGEVEVAFRNNVGERINITGDGSSTADGCENVDSVTIDEEESQEVTSGDQFLVTWECDDLVQGERVDGEFSFEYTNLQTTQTRTHTGDISVNT